MINQHTPHLLVIDDDADSRMIIAQLLGREFNITEAESGEQGLVELHQAMANRQTRCGFDAVMVDLVMPGLSGIETIRYIRNDVCQDLPIIAITAGNTEAALRDAFAAGATDYLPKPVTKVELLARVNVAIRLKREMDMRLQREQDLEIANKKLLALSRYDTLTGLANRRYFDDSLDQAWQRATSSHTPISLLMADIDHFKRYNDHYGHLEGDLCLQQVANVLRHDCDFPDALAARWGGEEFIVMLPGTDQPSATNHAQTLLNKLRQCALPHAESPTQTIVTMSIGIASTVPNASQSMTTLLATVDRALYQAKEHGRNGYAIANITPH